MLSAAAAEAIGNKSATSEHALHAKARAVMFYRRACELGDPQGCRIYRKSPDGLKVRLHAPMSARHTCQYTCKLPGDVSSPHCQKISCVCVDDAR